MKTLKKFLCTITVLALMLSLTGCPMTEDNKTVKVEEVKEEKQLTETEDFIKNDTGNVRSYIEQSVKKSFAAEGFENIEVKAFAEGNKIDVVVELTGLELQEGNLKLASIDEEALSLAVKDDFAEVKSCIESLEGINLIIAADGGIAPTEDLLSNVANPAFYLKTASVSFE